MEVVEAIASSDIKMSGRVLPTGFDENEVLPLDMDGLPEFFQQKAVREINYSPETSKNAMRELKELIQKDDIIRELMFTDTHLEVFLTCRKFNATRAFKQLRGVVQFIKQHPEIFCLPSYDDLSIFMTEEVVTLLPWRCREGCSILYINTGRWNVEKQPVEAVKQFYAFVILQSLTKPMTQVNGFKVIMDLGITRDILKCFTPSLLNVFIRGVFILCPGRFKVIHFVKVNGVGRLLWHMMKMILPTKLKNRVHIHETNDTLLDFFPKEILPCNLGGNLKVKDYDMTWWLKKYLGPDGETMNFDTLKVFDAIKEY